MTPRDPNPLIVTCPACIRRASRTARPMSDVHTHAFSPYRVPLAISTASSSESKLSTDSTGPKISSCAIRMSGVTRSKIVGSTKNPPSYFDPVSLCPPVTTSAPSRTPMSR
jgi:hypothetical protein